MAAKSYVPPRDQDFSVFAINFHDVVDTAPENYGLTVADVTTLTPLLTAFTTALEAATNPDTRTKVTVAAKNTARAALTAEIRSLVRRIQATPTVTAAQKASLGLNVPDKVPTPVPPPATRPLVNLLDTAARTHLIRLADETTPSRRARPVGTAGAEVYVFVPTTAMPTPPESLDHWEFKGLATRNEFKIEYDPADAGKQATIITRWYNDKGQTGPLSTPITGTIAA